MKVFSYISTPGGLTGAPRRLLTLASALRDQGIEMCIATRRDSELFMAAEELGLKTVASEPVGVLRQRHGALFRGEAVFRVKVLVSLLVQNLGIARKIRKQGADVVWTRGSKGVAFAGLGAILARRPLIWDVDYELPSRGLVRWLHRFGLFASRAVVFQYGAAPESIFGRELAQHYREKFHVIIPGIDLGRLEGHRETYAWRSPGQDDPFVILQVGTLCDRKNQILLLEALRDLDPSSAGRKVVVRFAGGVFEEEYARKLQHKASSFDGDISVEFLGWRDDVHDLMVEADLLVMPSKDEGVPNTVQEAMYIGRPVLVSDRGGMPEIVEHGETGWVLPIDDAGAWSRQVQACMEAPDSCREIGIRASEHAGREFGTERWAARYADLIKGLSRQGTAR